MFRRLTEAVTAAATSAFDFYAESSEYKNPPDKPTAWKDDVHRKPLLKTWNEVKEEADNSTSKYGKPRMVAQLWSTEKRMLLQFPELLEGQVLISREWIEFVLGVCKVQPFSEPERMSRWQILAVGGGPRMNWGPW